MTTATISGKQMKRLQTLWGMFARHANLDAKDRETRLGWVAGAVGRQISSFNELRADEAKTAIDAIQKHLPAEMLTRRRPSRDTAHAYGTAGRSNSRSRLAGADKSRVEAGATQIRMADAGTLQLLSNLCTALGWGRERLDAFLMSRKSPVKSGKIRTLGEANRVIWVLKSLLRRAEASEKARTSPAGMTAVRDLGPAPQISNAGADREIGVPVEVR